MFEYVRLFFYDSKTFVLTIASLVVFGLAMSALFYTYQDLDKAIALLDRCNFFPKDGIRQEFEPFKTFTTHLANLTEYTTDVVRFVKILQDEEYKKMYEQLEALFID